MIVETITHNGHEIILADFTGCTTPQDRMDLIDDAGYLINRMPDNSVLNLALFHGQKVNQQVIDHATKWTKKNEKKFKKSAIVGISGLQTIFLNALNRINKNSQLKAFKTQEEALDYLTQ